MFIVGKILQEKNVIKKDTHKKKFYIYNHEMFHGDKNKVTKVEVRTCRGGKMGI